MDWIKVKVKHGEYEFADAPDNVFRAWIMMMLFIAATEKIPSEIQLEARLGKDNYRALCSHLSRNGVTMRRITDKVMEDVNMIVHKRLKGRDRQTKFRQEHTQSNALHNELVTEADKIREDKIREEKNKRRDRVTPQEFILSLKTNPAYKHVNIDNELLKMDTWLATHPGRKKTPRFILNWINKIEVPLPATTPQRRMTA
jgi:hypothetical protein